MSSKVIEKLEAQRSPLGEDERAKRRQLARAQLQADIAAGVVDLGPITEHEPVTEDIRDKRDPIALGKALDQKRHGFVTIKGRADYLDSPSGRLEIPDYDPGESMVVETAKKHRAELEERAANGDRFAISMLETGLPGDSDE